MTFLDRAFKFLWIYFWAGFATLVVFLPVLVSAILSPSGNSAFTVSRVWAWVILRAAGVRIRTRGLEKIQKNRSYVIIANHQSVFDAPAIIAALGIQFRWVVKKELMRIPLFGSALYASRNIFVDRTDKGKAVESIRKGLERLPPGVSILFFAEGTRSPDGRIQPFKKGGFVAAVENRLPVLPITLNGSRKVLPKGSSFFKPGPIEIVVGDAIETRGFPSGRIEELVEKTRGVIVSNFKPNYPFP